MEGPKNGGVGRQLGSNGRKAGRKSRSSKPGPKPKKVNKKQEQKKRMAALNQTKEDKRRSGRTWTTSCSVRSRSCPVAA